MKPKRLPVIPSMRCDDFCGDCCGIVPASPPEFQRIERFVAERDIKPVDQGHTCPFFQVGQCAVYEVRPFICRLFGHVEGLTCPNGHNVNLSNRDARKLQDHHFKRGERPRLLHELIPGWSSRPEAIRFGALFGGGR